MHFLSRKPKVICTYLGDFVDSDIFIFPEKISTSKVTTETVLLQKHHFVPDVSAYILQQTQGPVSHFFSNTYRNTCRVRSFFGALFLSPEHLYSFSKKISWHTNKRFFAVCTNNYGADCLIQIGLHFLFLRKMEHQFGFRGPLSFRCGVSETLSAGGGSGRPKVSNDTAIIF